MTSSPLPVRQLARRAVRKSRFLARSYRFREMLREHPGYRATPSHGRWFIADVSSRLPMTAVMQANLDLVAPLLRLDDAPLFIVPTVSENRTRIGVPDAAREAFLSRLMLTHAGEPVYLDVYRASGTTRSVLVDDLGELLTPDDRIELVRVYRFYAWPHNAFAAGSLHAAEVEFWAGAESQLIAPFGNRIAGVIPKEYATSATIQIGGKAYPTLEPFADPTHVDQLDFPVDIVFPLPYGQPRPDRPALRRALRSLWMHTEGFRRIHIVVDGAAPSWLDTDHPDISVVPATALKPIDESDPRLVVAEIEDLAERYVLFADGVHVRRPFRPTDCFLSNGLARLFAGSDLLCEAEAESDPAEDALEPVQEGEARFAQQASGRRLNRGVLAPRPMVRNDVVEVQDLARRAGGAARPLDPIDVQYFTFGAGRAVPAALPHVVVDLHAPNLRRQIRGAAEATTFSLLPNAPVQQAVAAAVQNWYPVASPYERG